MNLDDLQLAPEVGEGLVLRAPGVVLFVAPDGVGLGAVDPLIALCRQAAGASITRDVARLILDAEPGTVPPFAVAGRLDTGLAVLVHGAVDVRIEGATTVELSGQHAATWVDRVVDEPFDALSMRAAGAAAPGGGWIDPRLDLRDGAVAASGLVLHPGGEGRPATAPGAGLPRAMAAAPPPPAPAPSPPVAAPAPSTPEPAPAPPQPPMPPPPIEVPSAPVPPAPVAPPPEPAPAPVAPPVPDLPPLPSVPGVPPLPNMAPPPPPASPGPDPAPAPPASPAVSAGGLPPGAYADLPTQPPAPVPPLPPVAPPAPVAPPPPPEPVVARLRFAIQVGTSRTRYVLDHDCVIGRDPTEDNLVKAGKAEAIIVDDETRSVSRVHAEIRIRGADLILVDRGSVNGTSISPPGTGDWTALTPNGSALLERGTQVQLGRCPLYLEDGEPAS